MVELITVNVISAACIKLCMMDKHPALFQMRNGHPVQNPLRRIYVCGWRSRSSYLYVLSSSKTTSSMSLDGSFLCVWSLLQDTFAKSIVSVLTHADVCVSDLLVWEKLALWVSLISYGFFSWTLVLSPCMWVQTCECRPWAFKHEDDSLNCQISFK